MIHHAMSTISTQDREPRDGFTLIELLIVMGVIAALVAMSYTVIANYTESAQSVSTKATLLKVDELLSRRVEAFDRFIERSTEFNSVIQQAHKRLARQSGTPGHIVVSKPFLRILLRKYLYSFHFPQTYLDVHEAVQSPKQFLGVNLPPGLLPREPMIRYFYPTANTFPIPFTKCKGAVAGAEPTSEDNGELLYFVLTHATFPGAETIDDDIFGARELLDQDDDGLLSMYDAWEQPLRFYRWPTRLFRPTGAQGPLGLDNGRAYGAGRLFPGLPEIPREPARCLFRLWDSGRTYWAGEIVGFVQGGKVLYYRAITESSGVEPGSDTDKWLPARIDVLGIDPDDPFNILGYTLVKVNANQNIPDNVKTAFAALIAPAILHDRNTYHAPFVVSSGPSLNWGLASPVPPRWPAAGEKLSDYYSDNSIKLWSTIGRLGEPNNFDVLDDHIASRNVRPESR